MFFSIISCITNQSIIQKMLLFHLVIFSVKLSIPLKILFQTLSCDNNTYQDILYEAWEKKLDAHRFAYNGISLYTKQQKGSARTMDSFSTYASLSLKATQGESICPLIFYLILTLQFTLTEIHHCLLPLEHVACLACVFNILLATIKITKDDIFSF